ncbi:Squalestatin tetraketide synthase, partial [Frankliniella fusca]
FKYSRTRRYCLLLALLVITSTSTLASWCLACRLLNQNLSEKLTLKKPKGVSFARLILIIKAVHSHQRSVIAEIFLT